MATPQLSPGVLVREVDLTVGRAENVLDNIGMNVVICRSMSMSYPQILVSLNRINLSSSQNSGALVRN